MTAPEAGQVPLRRVLIGQALRGYRLDEGLTLEEAAVVLGCDRSKLSRIETGQRGIQAADLSELLAMYAAPDAERELLLRFAGSGRPAGLLRLLPAVMAEYLTVEAAASELLIWAPCLVPDLLQIPAYTRAVLDADPGCASPDLTARQAAIRQDTTTGSGSVLVDVLAGEAAFRQQVAGPLVMAEQAKAVAAACDTSPAIAVRLIASGAGPHALSGCGPFTLLRFRGAPRWSVVHLPGPGGGTSITGDPATGYLPAFTSAKTAALTPPRTSELLRALTEKGW